MSPIITTMSAPAGRGRRVRGPTMVSGTGPGPNAPSWSGKTVYEDEDFASPIPTASLSASGFRGFNGFGTPVAGGDRVEYPTVVTPLGTKTVLRLNYYGQTETLNAVDAVTTPFPFASGANDYFRASVYISGTWSATVQFESSVDAGASWQSISLTGSNTSEFGTPTSGTSGTTNGMWLTPTTGFATETLLRIRCSAYTSGTISVRVGTWGGQAPANFTSGTFTGDPTRIYFRNVWRKSANWSDGGNAGTKQVFFSKVEGNNHYIDGTRPEALGLQGSPTQYLTGTPVSVANGEWMDCEYLIESGTAGGVNGVFRAWVNGVLLNERTNVPYFGASFTPRFVSMYYDPTYGGGGRPAPANQYYDIAYMYRESAP